MELKEVNLLQDRDKKDYYYYIKLLGVSNEILEFGYRIDMGKFVARTACGGLYIETTEKDKEELDSFLKHHEYRARWAEFKEIVNGLEAVKKIVVEEDLERMLEPQKELRDLKEAFFELRDRVGNLEKRSYMPQLPYWGDELNPKPDWMDYRDFQTLRASRQHPSVMPWHGTTEPWGEYGYPYHTMSDSLAKAAGLEKKDKKKAAGLEKKKKDKK